MTTEPTGDQPEGNEVAGTSVEFTHDGYLRLPAELARRCFPTDALVAMVDGAELWLLPLIGPQQGGMVLKQRNPVGDRSALVWEYLPDPPPVGHRPSRWDSENGALRVHLG